MDLVSTLYKVGFLLGHAGGKMGTLTYGLVPTSAHYAWVVEIKTRLALAE